MSLSQRARSAHDGDRQQMTRDLSCAVALASRARAVPSFSLLRRSRPSAPDSSIRLCFMRPSTLACFCACCVARARCSRVAICLPCRSSHARGCPPHAAVPVLLAPSSCLLPCGLASCDLPAPTTCCSLLLHLPSRRIASAVPRCARARTPGLADAARAPCSRVCAHVSCAHAPCVSFLLVCSTCSGYLRSCQVCQLDHVRASAPFDHPAVPGSRYSIAYLRPR